MATSSEAIKKATGKTADEWIKIIDREGGRDMNHTEIARMLYDKSYIKKQKGWPDSNALRSNAGWWCQTVTVA